MATEETAESVSVAPEAAPAVSMEEAAAKVWAEDASSAGSVVDPKVEPSPATGSATESAEPAPAKAESVAKRITAAKRAEIRGAQERAAVRAEREQIERRDAELKAKEARFKLLEEDPVKAFDELKLDPKKFLERLAGEQSPENVVEKRLTAAEERAKRAEERAAAIEAEVTNRAKRASHEAAQREAGAAFVEHVTEGVDKYPHLVAEYTEAEVVEAAFAALGETVGCDAQGRPVTRVQQYHAQFGVYPDNDTIAEYLDAQAKARIEARQKSAWRKREVDPAATASKASGQTNPAAQSVRGSSPRTLTSRAASEKAAAPKSWSQEAADEESLRILQGAFR